MTHYRKNERFIRDLKEPESHASNQAFDKGDTAGAHSRANAPSPLAAPAVDTGHLLAQSRAAMLALIDHLARRGLPILSLTTIGIAALAGFYALALPTLTLPLLWRLCYWLVLALGSLFFTAHRLHQFRQGFAYSGRPFRWRAHYTATLSVLSTAIGSGAILLTPTAMPPTASLTIIGGVLLLGITLSLGHLAHRATALCASLPTLALTLLPLIISAPAMPPTMRNSTLAFLISIGIFLSALSLWAVRKHTNLIKQMLTAHPRQEVLQVAARQKKTNTAYNPFSFRLKEKPSSN